ncbi:hypothetical protein [Raineyella sp.]|uniref:hypothetical protein n=1 Tax=Raineyella sp. TaxID=1911550 RepID=UPI002B1E97EE|nr:hypothetical protein [Raineyella sp.]MEA5154279.1 hypothetical protein [Raineyella sp.]
MTVDTGAAPAEGAAERSGAGRRPVPEDAARIGVDLWDVTARLEASGFSDAAARAAGHSSASEWARELIADRARSGPLDRQTRVEPRGHLLTAALGRAIVMLAGVVICASTMPRRSTEVVVFAVAAIGWMTAQVVSAALWHGLGRGSRGEAVRGAMVVAGLMVLVGVGMWIAVGQPTVLIWVLWASSAPLLVTLRPGWSLVAWTGLAGGLCALAWLFGEAWQTLAVAGAATTLAAVSAGSVAGAAMRDARPGIVRGTTAAVVMAAIQTAAHLALLLAVFLRVGPGAFAAVALAGLAAGVLADPLFALARMGGGWVGGRFTSWIFGRSLAASAGPPLLATLCAVALGVALVVLADPYRIYLDEPLVLTAAVGTAAIVATINALLRTGSAFGAMFYTVVVCTVGIVALTYRLPTEDAWQSAPFELATAAMVTLAAIIVTHRLSRPQAW